MRYIAENGGLSSFLMKTVDGFILNTPYSNTKWIRFYLKKGLFFDGKGDTDVYFYWEYSVDTDDTDEIYDNMLTCNEVIERCQHHIQNELSYWEQGKIHTVSVSDEKIEYGIFLFLNTVIIHHVFPHKDICNRRFLIKELPIQRIN